MSALFDSERRAQSHTESDDPSPLIAVEAILVEEPASVSEQHDTSSTAAPRPRRFLGVVKALTPLRARQLEHTPRDEGSEPIIMGPLTEQDTAELAGEHDQDATPSGAPAANLWELVRRRPLPVLLITAGIVVVIVIGALLTSALVRAPQPGSGQTETAPAASSSDVTTLPGWSSTPSWAVPADQSAAAGDGSMALVRSGNALSVIDPLSGKQTDGFTLKTAALGVLSGYAGAVPAVIGYSADEAVLWTDPTHSTRFDLQEGQSVVSRSGQLFIDSGGFAEQLTKSGKTPFLAPREGVSLFGSSPAEMTRWASARGTLITGDLTGGIISETTLAPPAEGATVAGWVASVNDVTVTRWTGPAGSLLTTHNSSTGALIVAIATTGSGTPTLMSPDRSALVVDGHRVNLADGAITALPAGFVPSVFIGAAVFGTSDGSSAVLTGDTVTATPTPEVIPVSATPQVLLATSGDQLSGFPATKTNPSSSQSAPTPTTGGTTK